MIELVYFAIFYVLCCFVVIWRLIKGPTAPDRVVAGDCVDVLTDVGELKVSIISSGKTDKKTILYDAPTAKANEIMRLSNGTACFSLFGRKEGHR